MKLQPYGFCMVRRPLLSRNILEDFHVQTAAGNAEFESELRRIFSDPVLLEGLALSSGTVYELAKLFVQHQPINGKDKLLASLYKFLIRAASRSTPFGIFAGYFIVRSAATTRIGFSSEKPLSIHKELDAGALTAIKTHLLQQQHIASGLLYFTNNALYRVGQFYRYIKIQSGGAGQTTFELTQTPFHPLLENIVHGAKTGKLQSELASLVQSEHYSAAESTRYVASLVEAQILVSSIEPGVSGGKHYLSRIVDTLTPINEARNLTLKITNIQKQLADSTPSSKINASLSRLTGLDHPLESTLHSTLRFNTGLATISEKILLKLGTQLGRVGCLAKRADNAELDDFARRFFACYGQQKMPLMRALDYDYGIGYAALSSQTQPFSPLLDGIEKNISSQQNRSQPTSDLAHAVYAQSHTGSDLCIVLGDRQLPHTQADSLPSSFYVLGSFHAQSEQSLDKGDFLFELKGLAGPSAANLMSRFCADDPQLTSYVDDIIKTEQAAGNGLIYAQIAHLPAGKGANVVQRPDLTDVEITYLAASGKHKTSISPDDLWLSCPDGKTLLLSSPLLTGQIVPVLISAHHYGNGLPVYRFLCDLANQYSVSLSWDWGQYHSAAFLPRVQYQQIVLSKASWLVSAEQIKPGSESKTGWWKDLAPGTPRYFTTGQADQLLLFDSENEHSVSLFEKMLKKQGKLRITESLEVPGQGVLSQQDQYFANEFVIPYHSIKHGKFSAPQVTIINNRQRQIPQIQRQFTVGSHWLYVKIYCAETLSDALLTTAIWPLLNQLEREKVIEKWFFIRYYDPEAHIRLRFYGKQKDFWTIVLRHLYAITAPLLESGMVRSIQTDTYQRETERYAPEVYEQIETIFHADSQAVTRALKRTAQDAELRWLGALKGADLILDSFDFDLRSKLDLTCLMHDADTSFRTPEKYQTSWLVRIAG